MFCFNEFAFTVQLKHKINSTQILGFVLYEWPFPHVYFAKTVAYCSVFSDCVVFLWGYLSNTGLRLSVAGADNKVVINVCVSAAAGAV